MNQVSRALGEFQEMDALAAMDSPIHRLHPLPKLLTTILYIFLTVSFDKYDLAGLMPMVLYPMVLFAVTGIPVRTCFHKLRIVLPLVCAVGILNPFFDRAVLLKIGNLSISGGFVSMVTLMAKGVFCLMASFLLAATTTMDAICMALRSLHVPSMIVTLLLLTYRYVSVMISEVSVMTDAYHLRAPGQKGIHISAWGSFVGQLLLRSMDRAEELYQSMLLRGFRGEFAYARVSPLRFGDAAYFLIAAAALLILRFVPLSNLLGGMVI